MRRETEGATQCAVLCIVGVSDSGKTTLIEKLIPRLNGRGVRVGTIKHDVHGFEMDREGKDSFRHKKAGARVAMISSPTGIGMVRDMERDCGVGELVEKYFDDVDLVLTEGYKREAWPKIEVHRKARGTGLISRPEEGLVAVVSDEPLEVGVPCFPLDDPEPLIDFLMERFVRNRHSGQEEASGTG